MLHIARKSGIETTDSVLQIHRMSDIYIQSMRSHSYLEITGSCARCCAAPKLLDQITISFGYLALHAERIVTVELILVCTRWTSWSVTQLKERRSRLTQKILRKLRGIAHTLKGRVHEASVAEVVQTTDTFGFGGRILDGWAETGSGLVARKS